MDSTPCDAHDLDCICPQNSNISFLPNNAYTLAPLLIVSTNDPFAVNRCGFETSPGSWERLTVDTMTSMVWVSSGCVSPGCVVFAR